MSAPRPAIEAAGLGRDYGSTRALESLDLLVARGALVGLLGPNGAGKTTTMLLLATLLRPSRGTARVFGHDLVADRSAIRRCLGLVFQEPCIDGLLTVEENLLFAARLAELPKRDALKAVDDALERTRLVERASQLGRQLSGGWRRLADIARATVHRPALLILDEPTVGLDPEHRDRMWTLLDDERRARGTTIVFSTHYLTEAEACDYVVLLARGALVADGNPAALKATVGNDVAEIEGPDAARLLESARGAGAVRTVVRTERGYRIGMSGPREPLTALAAALPGVSRFAFRPPTLEDVYFERTRRDA
ncbi:MAG: ABC transporter ATP-binding protein [Acidobacteria bacterium]|nr:MAG: ABC transporter ATP-binding protein [Acidobacteriota bacterium]